MLLGGLAQSAHDLAHLLLGRGAQLGNNLLDQSLELLARNLRGQQALQNLDLLAQVIGTLLVGAGLDGHLQRLARLLNQTLDHAVDVFLGHIAALVDLDILHLGLDLANDGQANLVLSLHGRDHFLLQLFVGHLQILLNSVGGTHAGAAP